MDLASIYYDPIQPGSYSGASSLRRRGKVGGKALRDWLSSQDAYTLHKRVTRKFKRRKTIVAGLDSQWQGDLIDTQRLKRHNDGCSFIFTVIDVFSKQAWARPLKSKSGPTLVRAFSSILDETSRHPQKLQTDKGTEFRNRVFQSFLKKRRIHFFVSENEDIKAAVVERFNRTLKERLWRFFTHHNTLRYIEVLPQLVLAYNSTYHRAIKRAPKEVNRQNQGKVWYELFGDSPFPKKARLKVGDRVRLSGARRVFRKGYLPSWTEEVFKVSHVLSTNPTTYRIVDELEEQVKGTFYEQELQKVKVPLDKLYKVEKIVSRRRIRGKLQYFVKWEGFPSKFNQWIRASHLRVFK